MAAQDDPFDTKLRPYGPAAIDEAAALILEGLPVAIPTETVYGLAGDATNDSAVARIYKAKGRPGFNPLIIHVRDSGQAAEFALFSPAATAVADSYWPGALTLVLPRRPGSVIAEAATAGLATIAVRVPAHEVMQALLKECGKPLAAPSANASGGISPTSAEHVLKSLAGRIPLVVDGGATEHGLESTIVRVDGDRIALLRPGPIDFAEMVERSGLIPEAASASIQAPGQMQSHYAPSKPLRLSADRAEAEEWLIGFGGVSGDDTLSAAGNLAEAAARLFEALHRAELQPKPRIAVAPIPEQGIGTAINDRLRRAAAPRPVHIV